MELSEKRCDKKNFIETSTGNRGKDFSEVQKFYEFWSFEMCHARFDEFITSKILSKLKQKRNHKSQ